MNNGILPSPIFHSNQALNRLNDVHSHCRVESTLLTPLIQMLISSGNPTETHPDVLFNQRHRHTVI
jgi:hypothetical protein